MSIASAGSALVTAAALLLTAAAFLLAAAAFLLAAAVIAACSLWERGRCGRTISDEAAALTEQQAGTSYVPCKLAS